LANDTEVEVKVKVKVEIEIEIKNQIEKEVKVMNAFDHHQIPVQKTNIGLNAA
jgi:hypothetical protein